MICEEIFFFWFEVQAAFLEKVIDKLDMMDNRFAGYSSIL
jgi:hypothetical protein